MSDPRTAAWTRRLRRSLGECVAFVDVVVGEAAGRGVRAYLVGGPVRDLLLGEPVRDVDILLSDRLEEVARASADRLDGKLRIHDAFLTATIQGAGFRIDLSRARCETYARPGALPEVAPAAVEQDLARRDFSVNAIAFPLHPTAGESLVDPMNGLVDLERRRLRVLHEGSFLDDPTRLFRAARYAVRLGFRLEPRTAELARSAVRGRCLAPVSGERILAELVRMLDERDPSRMAAETEKLGLLGAVASGWKLSADAHRSLRRLAVIREKPPWPLGDDPELLHETGLRILLAGNTGRVRIAALDRLGLKGRRAEAYARDLEPLLRVRRSLDRALSAGEVDARLSGFSEAGLLALYCATSGSAQRRVERYATRLRHVSTPVDGHFARAMGAEGAAIGELLRAARARVLDGRPADEAWAKRWLARHGDLG